MNYYHPKRKEQAEQAEPGQRDPARRPLLEDCCGGRCSQQHPQHPPQDQYPHRKPWDVARMPADDHRPRAKQFRWPYPDWSPYALKAVTALLRCTDSLKKKGTALFREYYLVHVLLSVEYSLPLARQMTQGAIHTENEIRARRTQCIVSAVALLHPGNTCDSKRTQYYIRADTYEHTLCMLQSTRSVSYTHLTLPTIYSV